MLHDFEEIKGERQTYEDLLPSYCRKYLTVLFFWVCVFIFFHREGFFRLQDV